MSQRFGIFLLENYARQKWRMTIKQLAIGAFYDFVLVIINFYNKKADEGFI